MSVFNVPVVIGVNEEEIARQIESEVKDRVIANINEEVKKIIFKEESRYYYGHNNVTYNDKPLRAMIIKQIEKTIDEHKDTIIKVAAEKLADKLSRSKAVRECAAEVAEEVYGEITGYAE